MGPARHSIKWPTPARVMFWLKLAAAALAFAATLGGIARAVAPAVVVMRGEYDADRAQQAVVNEGQRVFRASMDSRLERIDDVASRMERVTIDLTKLQTQLDERTRAHTRRSR